MFTKLNQSLLSKHPLIWNTRISLIWPIALLVNILFYFFGFSTPIRLDQLQYMDMQFDPSMVQFAVLLSLLLLIFWLSLYLRNNPLKTFYPLSGYYLFKEYLLIIITLFLISVFPFTYQVGMYSKMQISAAQIDVNKESEIVNLAVHFLPYDRETYYKINNCDSITRYGWRSSQGVDFNASDTVPLYSNLCYEFHNMGVDTGPDRYALSKRARQWIRQKQEDSIRYVLSETVKLLPKYGSKPVLNIEAQVADVLDDTVRRFVAREEGTYHNLDYVNVYPATAALQNLQSSKEYFWRDWDELFIGFMYYILVTSIALFSFRLTKLRTWFVAMIALGILLVIFALFGVGGMPPDMMYVLYLIIWVGCIIYALADISMKGNKKISGIALLWFTWVLPSVPISLAAWLAEKLRPDYSYDYERVVREAGFSHWVDTHWQTIHCGTIIMSILVTGLLIAPIARRWQACPEE